MTLEGRWIQDCRASKRQGQMEEEKRQWGNGTKGLKTDAGMVLCSICLKVLSGTRETERYPPGLRLFF